VEEKRAGGEATGTFTLKLGSSTTAPIPVTATAEELRLKLAELSEIDDSGVVVTRTDQGAKRGYVWSITFSPFNGTAVMSHAGDIAELVGVATPLNDSATVSVNVTTVVQGSDAVSGTFKILFGDDDYYRYGSLAFDTTAEEMHAHMMKYFPSLPRPFTVDRNGPKSNGAYTWLVTYPLNTTTYKVVSTAPTTFRVHYDSLLPIWEGNRKNKTYMETRIEQVATQRIGGDFALTFKGETTKAIPAQASASEVQAALEGLTNIPNITVSVRTPEGFNGNKSWFVSFTSLANAGDMPMLGIDTSQLVGTDVNAKVSEYLKGDSLGIRSLEILNANAGDTFALEFNYTWPDA
jgi:hypothetical protein